MIPTFLTSTCRHPVGESLFSKGKNAWFEPSNMSKLSLKAKKKPFSLSTSPNYARTLHSRWLVGTPTSILKMETVYLSETLIYTYVSRRHDRKKSIDILTTVKTSNLLHVVHLYGVQRTTVCSYSKASLSFLSSGIWIPPVLAVIMQITEINPCAQKHRNLWEVYRAMVLKQCSWRLFQ
jgi:hypothetical protein